VLVSKILKRLGRFFGHLVIRSDFAFAAHTQSRLRLHNWRSVAARAITRLEREIAFFSAMMAFSAR
jgi:hypothetical protein